jgi:predicted dehydrogenase
MKIAILGAGRMGIRHALGITSISEVEEIHLIDQNAEALNSAKLNLEKSSNSQKYKFFQLNDYKAKKIDAAIIATTAAQRLSDVKYIAKYLPAFLLIEKPLGQSYQQVESLVEYLDNKKIKAYANLNMRLYKPFIQLRDDLTNFSQFQGTKSITINSGSIGIGANGIHYLDLLMFLLQANNAKLVYTNIEDILIPSGRGNQFADFGGSAIIEYYNNTYLGKAVLSFNAGSSVFGGWDIIGANGQILINELQQKRTDILRKPDSNLPVYRYAGDYLPPVEKKFESPFLGDLTFEWFSNYLKGKTLLPTIYESLGVHKLMFDWLSSSKQYQTTFPIT